MSFGNIDAKEFNWESYLRELEIRRINVRIFLRIGYIARRQL